MGILFFRKAFAEEIRFSLFLNLFTIFHENSQFLWLHYFLSIFLLNYSPEDSFDPFFECLSQFSDFE